MRHIDILTRISSIGGIDSYLGWESADVLARAYSPTIDTPSVRDEAEILQFVHEVLENILHSIEQLRFDETLYDPVRIPALWEVTRMSVVFFVSWVESRIRRS